MQPSLDNIFRDTTSPPVNNATPGPSLDDIFSSSNTPEAPVTQSKTQSTPVPDLITKTNPVDTSSLFSKFISSPGILPPKQIPGLNQPTILPQHDGSTVVPTTNPMGKNETISATPEEKISNLNTESASIDTDSKALSDLNDKITAEKDKVDPTNKKSVDSFNAMVNDYNTKSADLKSRVDVYNNGVKENNTNKAVTTVPNSYQNFLIHKGGKNVINPTTTFIGGVIDDVGQKIDNFIRSLDSSKPASQRIGTGIDATLGIANLVLLPITGLFKLADKIPVLNLASKGIENYSTMTGEALSQAIQFDINKIPNNILSQTAKDNISKPIGELGGFLEQAFLGEKVIGKDSPIPKAIDDLKIQLTKDLITQHFPEKTVYFNANQVKDIWQTNTILSTEEKSNILQTIGEKSENIRDAIKNGISIKVSPETLVTLEDKPYWLKIKQFFGAKESEPINISTSGGLPSQTVRGLLPAPGDLPSPLSPETEIHPVLSEEVKGSIAEHGPAVTHQALQDNVGLDANTANNIVQKNMPEPVLQNTKTAPSLEDIFNQGFKTPEEKTTISSPTNEEIGSTYDKMSPEEQKYITNDINSSRIKTPLEETVNNMITGKQKFSAGGTDLKAEKRDILGGHQAFLFRKDANLDALDTVASKVGVSSDELLQKYMDRKAELQRGFINVGAIAHDVSEAAINVKNFIDKETDLTIKAKDVTAKTYEHQGKITAFTSRLNKLMQNNWNVLSQKEWENVYRVSDGDTKLKLSDKEQKAFDGIIKPLEKLRLTIREQRQTLGGSVGTEIEGQSTPRNVIDKNNYIDRAKKTITNGVKKVTGNGGKLSTGKSSNERHRQMYSLENTKTGEETVAHITGKNKPVITFKNKVATDIGNLNLKSNDDLMNKEIEPLKNQLGALQTELKTLTSTKGRTVVASKRIQTLQKQIVLKTNEIADIEKEYEQENPDGKIFTDKDGNQYKIKQALTTDIETHTNLEYYKNPLANYAIAISREYQSLASLQLLDHLKNSPELSDSIVKVPSDKEAPKGFQFVDNNLLPQFRGYAMEPKLAEVLEDMAKRVKGNSHIPVFDEINNILIGVMVSNPIMHFPNLGQNFGSTLAAGGLTMNPNDFINAIKSVRDRDQRYLAWVEHGAPFQHLKGVVKDFQENILKMYTDEIIKNPTPHEELAKALGYANPIAYGKALGKMSENITWVTNDALMLTALDKWQKKFGGTKEETIKEVSKRMADYRLPSRILGSRTLSKLVQSRVFLFARYHYSGAIKPWIENLKDTANPNSTWQQRRAGVQTLAYFALMAFLTYKVIDKALQGFTGNSNTYESMGGPLKLIQDASKLASGQVSPVATTQAILPVTPVLYGGMELAYNTDLFTRNPIFNYKHNDPTAEGWGAWGTSMVAPLSSMQRMTPANFAMSLLGVYTPNPPAKQKYNAMVYDEKPIVDRQVKLLITQGKDTDAQAMIDEFNQRLITTYQQVMLQSNGTLLTDNDIPDFIQSEGIKTPGEQALANTAQTYNNGDLTSKSSLLDTIMTYAKAIGTDPITAFNRIFTNQQIVRVDNAGLFRGNAAVIVQRMALSDSEAIRSKDASAQNLSPDQMAGLQLDHFIPLEAGGSNDESNLDLVTTYQNEVLHNDVETPIAQALKNGTITRAKATEYLVRFKIGTLQEVPNQKYIDMYKNKYNSQPITAQEVKDEINQGLAK